MFLLLVYIQEIKLVHTEGHFARSTGGQTEVKHLPLSNANAFIAWCLGIAVAVPLLVLI